MDSITKLITELEQSTIEMSHTADESERDDAKMWLDEWEDWGVGYFDDYQWYVSDRFPVADLIDSNYWGSPIQEWLQEEANMHVADGHYESVEDYFDSFADWWGDEQNRNDYPIFATFRANGKLEQILDGHHRSAMSEFLGIRYVRAIFGVRKT